MVLMDSNIKKIKCLVVDDEPLARKILQDYIAKIEYLELAAVCENALDACNYIKNNNIDLIFLDIKMPGLSGIEFIKNISSPPAFIFTTAYENYALESYDLNALDYLLKPFSFERFFKAINKFIGKTSNEKSNLSALNNFDEAFIYVKTTGKMVKIFLKDILYVESLRNYIKIVTSKTNVITHKTMAEFEERLPDERFIRIHRSFLIAKDKINSFTSTEIEIAGYRIPVGRNYRETVLKIMETGNLIF